MTDHEHNWEWIREYWEEPSYSGSELHSRKVGAECTLCNKSFEFPRFTEGYQESKWFKEYKEKYETP